MNDNNKTKVKLSYRKGKVVKAHLRGKKRRLVAGIGIATGAVTGALIGRKFKRLGIRDGALIGASIGSYPRFFVSPDDNKATKQLDKAKKILTVAAGAGLLVGAGIAGTKYLKYLNHRKNKSIVLFDYTKALNNYETDLTEKAKKIANNLPKSMKDVYLEYHNKIGISAINEFNSKARSLNGVSLTGTTFLDKYKTTFKSKDERVFLIRLNRAASDNYKNRSIVDDLYNKALSTYKQMGDINNLTEKELKLKRKYDAIVSLAEKNTNRAQELIAKAEKEKMEDQFAFLKTIRGGNNNKIDFYNELKNLGFYEYDIKTMTKKHDFDNNFSLSDNSINFRIKYTTTLKKKSK